VNPLAKLAASPARVEFDPGAVVPEQLEQAVGAAGHQAALPSAEPAPRHLVAA